MGSAIAIPAPAPEPLPVAAAEMRPADGLTLRGARRRRLSPLTLRILGVNMLALAILAGGLLYLDRYEAGLMSAEFQALRTHGRLIAGALGEGAIDPGDFDDPHLAVGPARPLVRRLAVPTRSRVRLYDADGRLITDSALLIGPGGLIQIEPLYDQPSGWRFEALFARFYDWFTALPRRDSYPPFPNGLQPHLAVFPDGMQALGGDLVQSLYVQGDGHLALSVAVPVQRYRRIVGVLMLSRPSTEIDDAVRAVRLDILLLFGTALGITVLLSLYLAQTIARPIRRLAVAAERVRVGRGRMAIPDFTGRNDEIGDLSGALRAMTQALWHRLEAIESFAADVAHEIKNPLTSLRSAVETAIRLQDPAQQRRLLAIVLDDVRRLDRLISDIAGASRLDAELARTEPEPVSLGQLLRALAEVHEATRPPDGPADQPQLVLAPPLDNAAADPGLVVLGIDDRIVQILRNLIGNAESFSPPGGRIRVAARREGRWVRVTVEDDGPGIPDGKLEAIFERFYSERPAEEAFGLHSGLGLSISRQIALALGGSLQAENRVDIQGQVCGARFILMLPAAAASATLRNRNE